LGVEAIDFIIFVGLYFY